jgi:tRNA(Ile)-lysidine synthase
MRQEIAVTAGSRILVACSGGPDSMALLHTTALLSKKLGLSLGAAGVDHGLRPEAIGELDIARQHAADLGVPFEVVSLNVERGGNLQARARSARRQALTDLADRHGYTLIATGHHADDRAETVLIRLLRGAGPRGLAPLPPRDGRWVRPLIRARREDIIRHLARHRVAFATDPSNVDRRFLRARVRHEVLPLLESLSPGVVGHLNALADQLPSGSPPVVPGADGRPLDLGRAQIAQIQSALTRRRTAEVLLAGGRVLHVEGKTGRFIHRDPDPPDPSQTASSPHPGGVEPAPRPSPRNQPDWRRTSRGAKWHKSG